MRRRGSWSSFSPLTATTPSQKPQGKNSLPAPLKWLEDLYSSKSRDSSKLQPTITDANSIRANPVRPKTSADFRDYENENVNNDDSSPFVKPSKKVDRLDKLDLDYHPTSGNGNSLTRRKSCIDLQRSKGFGSSPLRNLLRNSLDDDDEGNDNHHNFDLRLHQIHEQIDQKIVKPSSTPLSPSTTTMVSSPPPLPRVSPPPPLPPQTSSSQPVIDARRRNYESPNRSTYIDERRRDYEHLYLDKNSNNNNNSNDINSNHRNERMRVGTYSLYDERNKDLMYDEKRRDIGYDERKNDIVYDEKRRDLGYDERSKDILYDDKKRDLGYDERKRNNLYDDRRQSSVYDDKNYNNYNKIRQQDNGFDERHNIQNNNNNNNDNNNNNSNNNSNNNNNNNNSRHDHHRGDYESRRGSIINSHSNNNSSSNHNNDIRVSGQHEQFNSQFSRGHTRNSSYASSSKSSSVLNDDGLPLSSNPSYLERIRHKSSFSDTSSISTISSPATPNGLYDNVEQKWRPNNGLDPRIYKEQPYASSVISKASSKSWQVDDININKDRYHQSSAISSELRSSSRNKFYIDGNEEIDEDDDDLPLHSINSINSISKRQTQPHLTSLMLKDRHLTSIGTGTPSTPRSYSSMHSSPSYTRDSSPTRDSLYSRDSSSSRRYQRVMSPVYSSRPVSRASVSSSATSIEEESAILTDMLRDADGLTIKNLTSQMSLFKARDFNSVAPGIDLTKPKTKTSRSTPTPGVKRAPSVSTGSRALSTPTPTTKSMNKAAPTKNAKGDVRAPSRAATPSIVRAPSRAATPSIVRPGSKAAPIKSTKGVKNNSTPGTPRASQPKAKGLTNSSSNKSTSNRNSMLVDNNISSYRAAYRPPPPPTDFSEARAALNRAKLKVEEMLELVSNGGTPFI